MDSPRADLSEKGLLERKCTNERQQAIAIVQCVRLMCVHKRGIKMT